MSSLKFTLLSFSLGVALTSAVFTFFRPVEKKIPPPLAADTSLAREDKSPGTDHEHCEQVLGLFRIPLLEAPAVDPSIPPTLTSKFEGDAYLKWLRVPNAKDYLVIVTTEDGKEIKTYRTQGTGTSLKDLPRPKNKASEKYLVKVASVNANNLVGDFSTPRDLIVKKSMNLTAPKIKEIRIED